jgi:RimJ/RimL family protein N-acetyltransferase
MLPPSSGSKSRTSFRPRTTRRSWACDCGVNARQNLAAVELGYTIFPAYRGHGYATRAATILMDIAEERGGIRHFVLSVGPHNEPSLAIVRKLGFVRTGEQMDEIDGLEYVFELSRSASAAP